MDSPSFSQFLEARTCAVNSLLCVGLDPHISELPAPTRAAAVAFCRRIVDARKRRTESYLRRRSLTH